MTSPDPFDGLPRSAVSTRLLRDLLAVFLVLAGVAGLLVAAYCVAPLLALTVLSVFVIGAGVLLGVDR